MILKHIHLHPFAGISDKIFHFKPNLSSLFGPNEIGKSTVAKALRMVLFCETNLTRVKKQNVLRDLLPVAGGDTIRITLEFVYKNINYTLSKQWGPTCAIELKSSEGVTLTDNDAVQMQIQLMLPASQAIVEQVLIASQTQLADAVDKLSTEVQMSLSDQLRSTILKAGGLSATQLESTVRLKAESYFGRWDELGNAVEGGASRGVSNQWKAGIGHIASAWYRWQEAILTESEIENYESEHNRLQAELNQYNDKLKEMTSFLSDNKDAYVAVNRRIAIELDIEKYRVALENFAGDAQRWPTALVELENANAAISRINTELDQLNQERVIARQKEDAVKDIAKLELVIGLRKKEIESLQALAELDEINETDLKAAKSWQQEFTRSQILIDGQKLRLQLNPSVSGSIEVTHSGGKSETIDFISGERTDKAISGSIAFAWRGLSFCVHSANQDILSLEAALHNSKSNLNALLEKYDAPSVEILANRAVKYQEATQQLQLAKSNLQAALGLDDLERLKTRCEKASSLPGSRDIKALEELTTLKNNEYGHYNTNITNCKREIADFENRHISLANLDERRLNGKQAIKDKERELSMLAPLPDNFETAAAFQQEYTNLLEHEKNQSRYKHELELKKQALKEPVLSISEARERAELTKRKFENALDEGRAFRRIQEALQIILNATDNNAFLPLHQKTEAYLQKLSAGRFSSIPFDATLPQALNGDGISLPVEILSKGTKDILALAFRLAAAEVYLKNNSGFVVMDDPLVDMDRNRREASVTVLKEFSKSHQTIIFTCHEEHARLLDGAEAGNRLDNEIISYAETVTLN